MYIVIVVQSPPFKEPRKYVRTHQKKPKEIFQIFQQAQRILEFFPMWAWGHHAAVEKWKMSWRALKLLSPYIAISRLLIRHGKSCPQPFKKRAVNNTTGVPLKRFAKWMKLDMRSPSEGETLEDNNRSFPLQSRSWKFMGSRAKNNSGFSWFFSI